MVRFMLRPYYALSEIENSSSACSKIELNKMIIEIRVYLDIT
jgi:hypothetical protein